MAEVEVVVVLELGSSSISINECNSCIIIITIIIKLSFIACLNKNILAQKRVTEKCLVVNVPSKLHACVRTQDAR